MKYVQPARTFQTTPAKLHDMNRDGILDVLQQPHVGHSAPVLYGAPVNFGSTMSVTGVDMNRDGIPNVLQVSQVDYSAPLPYGAPVGAAPIFQGANLSLQFVWLWCQVCRGCFFFCPFFYPVWVINLSLSLCGHMIPLGFKICALVYKICKNVQESSNYDSRLVIVYTDFLLFPCFYMLSFALSNVYRELMWPWWRERNFSSPTRSSSSSELGLETGVCLEMDVKTLCGHGNFGCCVLPASYLGESATAVPLSACLGFKRSPLHRR